MEESAGRTSACHLLLADGTLGMVSCCRVPAVSPVPVCSASCLETERKSPAFSHFSSCLLPSFPDRYKAGRLFSLSFSQPAFTFHLRQVSLQLSHYYHYHHSWLHCFLACLSGKFPQVSCFHAPSSLRLTTASLLSAMPLAQSPKSSFFLFTLCCCLSCLSARSYKHTHTHTKTDACLPDDEETLESPPLMLQGMLITPAMSRPVTPVMLLLSCF